MDTLAGPNEAIAELHLVGPLRAATSTGDVPLPRSKKARAILAVLALSPDGRCSRSHLASLLWDGSSQSEARGSLRQALHELSKGFEDAAPGFLRIDRDHVAFDRQRCWIDVWSFGHGACDPRRDLSEIVALNPDRLLEGMDGLSDSFDDLLASERSVFGARLRKEIDGLLEAATAGQCSTQQRQTVAAQILEFDPTHERASRTLMRALADLGETAAALKEFERCRAALRAGLDVEPSAETRALHQAIRASSLIPLTVAGETPPPFSIAVLAFENLNRDPGQDYFADGIAEDIIAALSRFRYLFVIARGSSFPYKGANLSIKQIGRELRVRYILEGSVRRADGRIRITSRLIEAATGAHLWADRFDGPASDVFDLQDRLTAQVVGAIAPTLRVAEMDTVRSKRPENMDAYELLLRARDCVRRGTSHFQEALDWTLKAIDADPGYGPAYGYAAWLYTCLFASYPLVFTRASVEPEATRLAWRASELAPDDADALALTALTFIHFGDPQEAVRRTDRAVELNPNLFSAWINRGFSSLAVGASQRAIDAGRRAAPLSPREVHRHLPMLIVAYGYFQLGRYDEAYAAAEQAFLTGKFLASSKMLAAAAAFAGRTQRARDIVAQMLADAPNMTVASSLGAVGNWPEAERLKFMEALRLAGLPE